MKAERFEELEIWKMSRALVTRVYVCFDAESLGGQDYGFRNQITRAAVSVMNNIAEGFERATDKDFAHFLTIAKASSGEVRSMLYAAEDIRYLDAHAASKLRTDYERLSRGIAKLASYLRN
jgi:four helix bundle protein